MARVRGRWHGKPGRIRRGPATVTGEVDRTRESAGHWFATASREGAVDRPGSQETCADQEPTKTLVERGWHL